MSLHQHLFGRRLRQLREERRLRAADVARLLDVDPSHYYSLERGATSPSFNLLLQLSLALRCDLADLFVFPDTSARDELRELIRRAPNSALAALREALQTIA